MFPVILADEFEHPVRNLSLLLLPQIFVGLVWVHSHFICERFMIRFHIVLRLYLCKLGNVKILLELIIAHKIIVVNRAGCDILMSR